MTLECRNIFVSHNIVIRGGLAWRMKFLGILLCLLGALAVALAGERWSVEKAIAWQQRVGYQAGVNFIPSTADNELEMFQDATWDPKTIDRELSWAANTGFNTIRVFLHHILWQEDSQAFIKRVDEFLGMADKYGITTTLVLLDSCWNAYPMAGTQPEPIPGVHNSQWVQCPGYDIVHDTEAFKSVVLPYVTGMVSAFKDDKRVLAWDVWNEPNNSGYANDLIGPLLKLTFSAIRTIEYTQPLTTPIWQGVDDTVYSRFNDLQLVLSDVFSFHNYADATQLEACIARIRLVDATRPIICTEYMARTAGSTFEPHLDIMRQNNVFAYNWGLVSGRTQTIYPWSTTTTPATEEPAIWFHDIFRADGTPFNASEISYIQSILLPKTKV